SSASETNPGFIITRISSTPGARSNSSSVCSRIVFPAIFSSCLGVARPMRRPLPPASTTAMVRVPRDGADAVGSVAGTTNLLGATDGEPVRSRVRRPLRPHPGRNDRVFSRGRAGKWGGKPVFALRLYLTPDKIHVPSARVCSGVPPGTAANPAVSGVRAGRGGVRDGVRDHGRGCGTASSADAGEHPELPYTREGRVRFTALRHFFADVLPARPLSGAPIR